MKKVLDSLYELCYTVVIKSGQGLARCKFNRSEKGKTIMDNTTKQRLKAFKATVKEELCITFSGIKTSTGNSAVTLLPCSLLETLERIDKAKGLRKVYTLGLELFDAALANRLLDDSEIRFQKNRFVQDCQPLLCEYEALEVEELSK